MPQFTVMHQPMRARLHCSLIHWAADPILHPAEELMSGLEFGAAQTLTDPTRAEVMARFKSA